MVPEMRFESRELRPYAEYVRTPDLQRESVYFYVNYVDEEGLIPNLQPVVYVGQDLDPDDTGTVYFQDAGSFLAGIRYGDTSETDEEEVRSVFYTFPAENGHVLEYEQALDVLLFCSLKRRDKAATSPG